MIGKKKFRFKISYEDTMSKTESLIKVYNVQKYGKDIFLCDMGWYLTSLILDISWVNEANKWDIQD